MKTNLLINNLVKIDKKQDYSDVSISIETIDKRKALEYLDRNFEFNRSITRRSIENYANQMRNGDWVLSWDAIAFNTKGELINGQHRLSGLIEANTSCEFFVIRNLPHRTAQYSDNGRKRTQSERITIAGTPMHSKSCSAIKNAFTDFKGKGLGQALYAHTRFDADIAKIYKRHSKFFELLEDKGYIKNKQSTVFLISAAFKIFLELTHSEHKHSWEEAFNRSIFFMQLVYHGYSDEYMIDNETDLSPLKLKEFLETRKSRNLSTADMKTFKAYIITAHQFMLYKVNKVLRIDRQHSIDPFPSVDTYKATNDLYKTYKTEMAL